MSTPAQDKLDDLGESAILDRLVSGEKIKDICAEQQIGISAFYSWVRAAPERSARVQEALMLSAESIRDKGTAALESALRGEVDANAARYYAQDCAQRAAIRNPQYRERSEVTQINVTAQMSEDDLRAQLLALEARTGLLQRLGLQGRVLEHDAGPAAPAISADELPPPAD